MRKFLMVSSCIACLAALFFVSCENNVAVSGDPETSLQYTVTFDLQNGTPPPTFKLKQQITAGKSLAEPQGTFTKAGHTFKGWSQKKSGNPKYDFKTPVKSNLRLYAIWEKDALKQFTVTFDLQGGKAPDGFELNQKVVDGEKIAEPTGLFTKDGHTFKGWSQKESGDPLYNFNEPVKADITLFAIWEKIPDDKWVVTLDYNDGKTPVKTQLVDKNSEFLKPTPDPERDGYKFLYWQKQGETGAYNFGQNVTAHLTLQAQWEKKPWKVTFNFNGGKNTEGQSEVTIEVKDGEKVTEPTNITKDGFAVSHWGISENTQKRHAFNFDSPITGDLILYIIWENVYTVTFDADGGTVTAGTLPIPQKIPDGKAVPESLITGLTLTKTGYVYKHWTADGKDPFEFGQTKVTGNITLKPLWKSENITVTLKFSYEYPGAPDNEVKTIKRDSVFTKPTENLPQRDGYVIADWRREVKNGKVPIATSYDFTKPVENDLVLYAIWKKSNITVTFDWNYDGSGSALTKTGANGNTFAMLSVGVTPPDRPGYVFLHWSEKKNGKTAYQTDKPIIDDLTLYAQWVQKHTVTFDLNQGTGTAPAEQTVLHNDHAQEPNEEALKAFSRKGYYFKHWTADTASNAVYNFGKVTQNTTLFAVWGKLSTVTFYANGVEAQPIPAPEEKKPGEKITKPAQDPTAAGYTFKFWSKKHDADPAQAADAFNFDTETIAENVDVPLYAIWLADSGTTPQPKKWTVKFNLNGAPAQTTPDAYKDQTVPDDTFMTTPAAPTWDGYIFRHWSEASSGTDSEKAYNTTATKVTKDMTLYAIWKLVPKKHTVHFDLNTGTGAKPADKQVEHGQKVSAPAAEEVSAMTAPVGHHFKHWSRTQAAGSAAYTFEDEVVTAELTLYAIWEKNDIEVTLVDNNNNNTEKKVSVKYGDTADVLSTPEDLKFTDKPGHDFLHWSKENNPTAGAKSTDAITQPITLYPVWQHTKWVIYFDPAGGKYGKLDSEFYDEVKFNEIAESIKPNDKKMKKKDASFKHWVVKETNEMFDFTKPVTKDTNLLAVWDEAQKWTVTFDLDGGKCDNHDSIAPIEVPDGKKLHNKLPGKKKMKKDGKNFKHWAKKGTPDTEFKRDTPIHENLELIAVWQ